MFEKDSEASNQSKISFNQERKVLREVGNQGRIYEILPQKFPAKIDTNLNNQNQKNVPEFNTRTEE